ncbi:hypothetical protein [Streptomyces celluloflavus]|uniref:hypothetical protein n=1 Tax=Streptomyces celluloflavus TaxID=58344 RepID=UPI00365DDB06
MRCAAVAATEVKTVTDTAAEVIADADADADMAGPAVVRFGWGLLLGVLVVVGSGCGVPLLLPPR